MIASVRGRVASVAPDGAVVELGGVGLAVQCTPGTLAGLRVGTEARLATSLVVREDSLTLYGFADEDEKQLFELLQTASGVGPRLAQAVLAVHSPDAVRRAIAGSDLAALTRVPGIGRYFVTATTGRDYPVLLALALLFGVVIITMNILVDLTYAALDPQVRYG